MRLARGPFGWLVAIGVWAGAVQAQDVAPLSSERPVLADARRETFQFGRKVSWSRWTVTEDPTTGRLHERFVETLAAEDGPTRELQATYDAQGYLIEHEEVQRHAWGTVRREITTGPDHETLLHSITSGEEPTRSLEVSGRAQDPEILALLIRLGRLPAGKWTIQAKSARGRSSKTLEVRQEGGDWIVERDTGRERWSSAGAFREETVERLPGYVRLPADPESHTSFAQTTERGADVRAENRGVRLAHARLEGCMVLADPARGSMGLLHASGYFLILNPAAIPWPSTKAEGQYAIRTLRSRLAERRKGETELHRMRAVGKPVTGPYRGLDAIRLQSAGYLEGIPVRETLALINTPAGPFTVIEVVPDGMDEARYQVLALRSWKAFSFRRVAAKLEERRLGAVTLLAPRAWTSRPDGGIGVEGALTGVRLDSFGVPPQVSVEQALELIGERFKSSPDGGSSEVLVERTGPVSGRPGAMLLLRVKSRRAEHPDPVLLGLRLFKVGDTLHQVTVVLEMTAQLEPKDAQRMLASVRYVGVDGAGDK